MDTSLRLFLGQLLGVVAAALVPLVLLTFLWVPFTLGGHPGEMRSGEMPVELHLT